MKVRPEQEVRIPRQGRRRQRNRERNPGAAFKVGKAAVRWRLELRWGEEEGLARGCWVGATLEGGASQGGEPLYLVGEQVAHLRNVINETSSSWKSRNMKSWGASKCTEKIRVQWMLFLGLKQYKKWYPQTDLASLSKVCLRTAWINDGGNQA